MVLNNIYLTTTSFEPSVLDQPIRIAPFGTAGLDPMAISKADMGNKIAGRQDVIASCAMSPGLVRFA